MQFVRLRERVWTGKPEGARGLAGLFWVNAQTIATSQGGQNTIDTQPQTAIAVASVWFRLRAIHPSIPAIRMAKATIETRIKTILASFISGSPSEPPAMLPASSRSHQSWPRFGGSRL